MPAPTVYNALRLYLKFDDLTGPLTDSSYRLNQGVLTNAATAVGGKYGLALRTSNATGKVTVANDVSLSPLKAPDPSPDGALSISVWVKLDKSLSTMWGAPTFASKLNGSSGYFLGCLTSGTNVVSFRVFNLAGTDYTATYTEAATSGWVHYVAVCNRETVRLYRNGVQVGSIASDGAVLQNSTDLTIGTGFEGLIDEFSLWGRNLSTTEITALYNAGAGLELRLPSMSSTTEGSDSGFLPDPYIELAPATGSALALVSGGSVPAFAVTKNCSTTEFVSSTIPDPYTMLVLGRRIYVDPQPDIVSIDIDSNYNVTAIGAAGPTDATYLTTWWQIDLGPNQVFVIASRASTTGFLTRQNQTDHFIVPRGQNWQGLQLTFWLQSTLDADQMWSSAPYLMLDDLWDNSGSNIPYPSVIDGMSLLLKAVNSWTTTLLSDIDAATSIVAVESVAGLEITGGVVSIGTEVLHYRSLSLNGPNPVLMGVTRGYDNTTAGPHGAGAIVEARIVAAHHNNTVSAIRAIEGAIGTNPAADPLTGKTFGSLQDRLASTLPLSVSKPLTRDWSFTHDRGRVVTAQLWALQDDGTHEQIIAPMYQKIDPNGESLVSIMLDNPQTGYILVN